MSPPRQETSILISGAGVGGLMTALELHRHGFQHIRVLERNTHNSHLGDSFTIGATAVQAFKNWPWMQQRSAEIGYEPLAAMHTHTGERVKGPMEFGELMGGKGRKGGKGGEEGGKQTDLVPKVYRHTRPKFHGMLLEQLGSLGIAVEYGKAVASYFEDADGGKGGVMLQDGEKITADLVVAADGINTASQELVTGHPVPARPSGSAIWRVAFPVEVAMEDPVVAERFKLMEDGRSVIELWFGPGMHGVFWRSEDQMSWAITHPDEGTAAESWLHRSSPEEVLKFTAKIPGWPEVADRVIKLTPPDQLVHWQLKWRDPQPKSTSPAGRVIQLGDAAHTFLPTSGSGGTQAMEDAVSLATCLSLAKDNADIPEAIRVHELLRFERVSCLQAFGVKNAKDFGSAGGKPSTAKPITNPETKTAQAQVPPASTSASAETPKPAAKGPPVVHVARWMLEHDPEQYAIDNYGKALSHLTHGTAFENTNKPMNMKYRPWTIDGLLEARRKGEPTVLDGDWS
ncbi:hypothetical protein LTR86_009057 [Recurvomyces mirabilis]|nr:hypothetical protein LTR86_009057 [Recurvomyces mirabilis]